MRLLGVSRQGINISSGLMDIGHGISISTYMILSCDMYTAASAVFDSVCKKAVAEEKEKNVQNGRPEAEFKVSDDGSWKKRGFSSLYGVTTLIGYYSGKVLDLVVKSGYC